MDMRTVLQAHVLIAVSETHDMLTHANMPPTSSKSKNASTDVGHVTAPHQNLALDIGLETLRAFLMACPMPSPRLAMLRSTFCSSACTSHSLAWS